MPSPDPHPRSPAAAAAAIFILLGGGLGLWRGFIVLRDLPASASGSDSLLPTLGLLAAVALVVLIPLAVLPLAAAGAARAHRRAGGFTLSALGLGFVFWWLPIPFAPTRLLTFILLLTGAALHAIVAVRALGVHTPAWPRWTGPGAAGAAVVGGGLVMLLIKINALAWSTAID